MPHVFGMAVANDHIYWTDWTYRYGLASYHSTTSYSGILRADKRNGANVTVLAQTALLPYSIKVTQ